MYEWVELRCRLRGGRNCGPWAVRCRRHQRLLARDAERNGGVPFLGKATPAWVLVLITRWNECLLRLGPVLCALRVMPGTVGSPCLHVHVVAKMTQDSRPSYTCFLLLAGDYAHVYLCPRVCMCRRCTKHASS